MRERKNAQFIYLEGVAIKIGSVTLQNATILRLLRQDWLKTEKERRRK